MGEGANYDADAFAKPPAKCFLAKFADKGKSPFRFVVAELCGVEGLKKLGGLNNAIRGVLIQQLQEMTRTNEVEQVFSSLPLYDPNQQEWNAAKTAAAKYVTEKHDAKDAGQESALTKTFHDSIETLLGTRTPVLLWK